MSLDDLLSVALPEDAGARQARVMVGGVVVPLHVREPDAPQTRGLWTDVDADRQPLEFGRTSIVVSRPPPDGDPAPRPVLFTEEFNLPRGRYRVAVVVQDRITSDVATATLDIEVPDERSPVGDLHLAWLNLEAAVMEEEKQPRNRQPAEFAVVPPTLPVRTWIPGDPLVKGKDPAAVVYGMCDPALEEPKAKGSAFRDWRLDRSLRCDGSEDPVPLAGGRIPVPGLEKSCVVVVDRIPTESLSPGTCHFHLTVAPPDSPEATRTLTFTVTHNGAGG